MRRVIVAVVCLLGVSVIVFAQGPDCDLKSTLKPSFRDIALLPTRLTAYNQHDDAATATYTCCKARQEKQIKAALAANEAFLGRFADTAFGDATLYHYGRVSMLVPDSYRNQEWAFRTLLENYPDSDLADDAAYRLGMLYAGDGQHGEAIKKFEFLVKKWPDSPWADHALHALIGEYASEKMARPALDALNLLAYKYPKSEFCPSALNLLSQRYMEAEDYQSAVNASRDLIKYFPYSDLCDDAEWRIAQCQRLGGHLQAALDAYNELIKRWYGSDLTNAAMREANNLEKQICGSGQQAGAQLYNPEAKNPAKDAKDLWDAAKHLQNNGMHTAAVVKFKEFIDKFPGSDMWDDAWYEIGQSYMRQDMLFQNINKATGPDDIEKYREDFVASTGSTAAVPTDGSLSSLKNAQQAFAFIANNLKGSCLQCDALGQVARCFIPYGEIEEAPVPPDAAFTYQEMVINFPTSSTLCPWFTDSTWPVYAFCRMMDFYQDEKNWDVARAMYPQLSQAYTAIFPQGLEANKTAFYELMKLYYAKTDHAYYEMSKHVPYAIGPADLLPEAHYFQSAMLMDEGNFQRAAQLLKPLAELQGHSLVPAALYLYAQANVKLGNWAEAQKGFSLLVDKYKNTGLADDAQLSWAQYQELSKNPAAYDLTSAAQQVREKCGVDPATMDVFVGQRCIVFCPFTRAALMRQYNMPNIWDEGLRILRDWAGLPDKDKVIVVVDRGDQTTYGNPFKVAGSQIKDPPLWNIGLSQIAANVLAQGIPQLSKEMDLCGGIGQFVACSLQYDLVTETRDAIGSAAAVKLPQEEVINARNAALKALEEYVIAGEDGKLNYQVLAGMMYSLLDNGGFSKDRLIDREPYRLFFAKLKSLPANTKAGDAFAVAASTAFGDSCTQQLKDWRLSVPKSLTTQKEAKVGMVK